MAQVIKKQASLCLSGLDGNAYVILGAFAAAAKRAGWTREEIEAVRKEAKSKDYAHLLGTIGDHCVDPVGSDDDEDEDDE